MGRADSLYIYKMPQQKGYIYIKILISKYLSNVAKIIKNPKPNFLLLDHRLSGLSSAQLVSFSLPPTRHVFVRMYVYRAWPSPLPPSIKYLCTCTYLYLSLYAKDIAFSPSNSFAHQKKTPCHNIKSVIKWGRMGGSSMLMIIIFIFIFYIYTDCLTIYYYKSNNVWLTTSAKCSLHKFYHRLWILSTSNTA